MLELGSPRVFPRNSAQGPCEVVRGFSKEGFLEVQPVNEEGTPTLHTRIGDLKLRRARASPCLS